LYFSLSEPNPNRSYISVVISLAPTLWTEIKRVIQFKRSVPDAQEQTSPLPEPIFPSGFNLLDDVITSSPRKLMSTGGVTVLRYPVFADDTIGYKACCLEFAFLL